MKRDDQDCRWAEISCSSIRKRVRAVITVVFPEPGPARQMQRTCSMGRRPWTELSLNAHSLFLQAFSMAAWMRLDGLFFSQNLQESRLRRPVSSAYRKERYGSATCTYPVLYPCSFAECNQSLITEHRCCNHPVLSSRGSTSFNRFREVSSVVFIFLCAIHGTVYHTPERLHKKSTRSLISGNTSIRVLTIAMQSFSDPDLRGSLLSDTAVLRS